jgi:hypothetical protein
VTSSSSSSSSIKAQPAISDKTRRGDVVTVELDTKPVHTAAAEDKAGEFVNRNNVNQTEICV